MKLVWIAGMAIGSAVAIARPDAVDALCQKIYPSDAVQRQAMVPDPQLRMPAAPNFVDQWRAAGQGHLERNDVRAEQRGDSYLRAAAAFNR